MPIILAVQSQTNQGPFSSNIEIIALVAFVVMAVVCITVFIFLTSWFIKQTKKDMTHQAMQKATDDQRFFNPATWTSKEQIVAELKKLSRQLEKFGGIPNTPQGEMALNILNMAGLNASGLLPEDIRQRIDFLEARLKATDFDEYLFYKGKADVQDMAEKARYAQTVKQQFSPTSQPQKRKISEDMRQLLFRKECRREREHEVEDLNRQYNLRGLPKDRWPQKAHEAFDRINRIYEARESQGPPPDWEPSADLLKEEGLL
jgi:hypothetical protein